MYNLLDSANLFWWQTRDTFGHFARIFSTKILIALDQIRWLLISTKLTHVLIHAPCSNRTKQTETAMNRLGHDLTAISENTVLPGINWPSTGLEYTGDADHEGTKRSGYRATWCSCTKVHFRCLHHYIIIYKNSEFLKTFTIFSITIHTGANASGSQNTSPVRDLLYLAGSPRHQATDTVHRSN